MIPYFDGYRTASIQPVQFFHSSYLFYFLFLVTMFTLHTVLCMFQFVFKYH